MRDSQKERDGERVSEKREICERVTDTGRYVRELEKERKR